MSNLGKVSFSFSKISKKPSLQVQPKEIVKKVDKIEFIDSIENNSVQVINGEEIEENKPLIIPLQHPNLLIQSVIDTVKSRTENSRSKSEDDKKENGSNENEQTEAKLETGDEPKSEQPPKQETLEEMAARELIEAASGQSEKKPESTLTVPLANQNYDKAESTIDDYENIPVNDFGLAMLRGMGWDPKKGIGKNGQIVKVAGPSLRPKGLGLGADKSIASQKPVGKNVSEKEVLAKGSKVRVTVGPHKNLYGTVEGFDDDAGRINVFMALSNERISMNECFVQLVTPDEFGKYSKVININAYNNYKEKESGVTNVKQEEETDKKSNNGRTKSPDSKYETKDVRHASSSRSKYDKSKKYDLEDEKYSKDSRRGGSSSSRNKKMTKKYDSSSDSDSRKYDKVSKSSSSKDRHRSKRYDDSDDNRKDYKSKSKYESSKIKSSKKYSSNSDSSSDEKQKSKSRSKDSRRDRERRKSLSDSDEYDRKRTQKKSKKKRNRSRSRSGR